MTPLTYACAMLALTSTWRPTPPDQAREVCQAIERIATAQDLDPLTVAAMAWHESRFRPAAVNPRTGAAGAMQVLLGRRWSVPYTREELLDPWLSIEAGVLAAVRFRDHCGERWVEGYASGTACKAADYRRAVERYREQLAEYASREWRACW